MKYKTIAFQGTSLTSSFPSTGWQVDVINGLQASSRFALRNYDVGHPGWTSRHGLADVSRWAGLRPDIAVIEFAMNDAVTGSGISTSELRTNMRAIAQVVRAANPACSIFFMTMNPALSPGAAIVPALPSYYQAVRDEAVFSGASLIDNTPLWGVPAPSDIPDGIHPIRSALLSVLVPSIISSLMPLTN